jgi:hypothetical protein
MTLIWEGLFVVERERERAFQYISYLFGVLRLAGTRFTGDQHGLVLAVLHHVAVGLIRNREQMGWPNNILII